MSGTLRFPALQINKLKCFFGWHNWQVVFGSHVDPRDSLDPAKVYGDPDMFESRCQNCNKQRW